MADITVALDAGHGGSDPGAVFDDRREKDDTLRLTNAVGQILEDNGINVFYVRTGDEYETPFKKATDANNANADLFVSIHRNSSEYPNQYSGAETLVYSDSGKRAKLAQNINNRLAEAGFNNLGTSERPNLVVLKRTKMPAALVEAGFINTGEDNELFDTNFNGIAQAIADGIMDTLNIQTSQSSTASVSSASYNDNFMHESSVNEPVMPETVVNQTDMRIKNTPEQDMENEKLYRVQVGAYKNRDNADRQLDALMIEGFPAFIVYDNGYYKVQVGAFRYLINAIKMERRLRHFRYNTYIVYD